MDAGSEVKLYRHYERYTYIIQPITLNGNFNFFQRKKKFNGLIWQRSFYVCKMKWNQKKEEKKCEKKKNHQCVVPGSFKF